MQLGEIVWNGSFIKLVAMTDWRLQQQVWVLKSRLAHVAVSSMMVSTPRPVICIYIYIYVEWVYIQIYVNVFMNHLGLGWFGWSFGAFQPAGPCRTYSELPKSSLHRKCKTFHVELLPQNVVPFWESQGKYVLDLGKLSFEKRSHEHMVFILCIACSEFWRLMGLSDLRCECCGALVVCVFSFLLGYIMFNLSRLTFECCGALVFWPSCLSSPSAPWAGQWWRCGIGVRKTIPRAIIPGCISLRPFEEIVNVQPKSLWSPNVAENAVLPTKIMTKKLLTCTRLAAAQG